MTKEQKDKLSVFIDDLLNYKEDLLTFDLFIKHKKKNYSIEIDTGVATKPLSNTFSFNLGTNQKVYFRVCEDGEIILTRDDYESFSDNDKEFAGKYFNILKERYTKRQSKIIDEIVDSSYSDLKLRRDSNIGKLI